MNGIDKIAGSLSSDSSLLFHYAIWWVLAQLRYWQNSGLANKMPLWRFLANAVSKDTYTFYF